MFTRYESDLMIKSKQKQKEQFFQNIYNKSNRQDKIKLSLHQLSAQIQLKQQKQVERQKYGFRRSLYFSRKNPQNQSFNQLSDWNNVYRYKFAESNTLPEIAMDKNQVQQMKHIDFMSLKSDLLHKRDMSQQERKGFMNQVILRFNPRTFTNSLRKSLMSFHSKQKVHDPVSSVFKKKLDQRMFNLQKIKQKSKSAMKEKYPMNCTNMGQMPVSPINQKYTGIIRILKKSQNQKIKKKNLQLSQNNQLRATRFF